MAGTYAAEVLSDTPLAYYRLGEASGTGAIDSSGNARNGIYQGAPTLGQTAGIADTNKAAFFDGVDDQINLPSSLVIPEGSSFTIEWWQYIATADLKTAFAFSFNGAPAGDRAAAHAPFSDQNIYWDWGNDSTARTVTNYAAYLNKWTHVCLTFDAATYTHAITLNGVQVASLGQAMWPRAPLAGGFFGAYPAYSASYNHRGLVDEIAIYDKALPPDRRLAHYKAGLSAYAQAVLSDAPRGYWRLGESGAPVLDSSGNGINFASGNLGGTLVFGQPSLLPGDPDNASVAGTPGWLSGGTYPALDVRDVFTIEAWIKLRSLTNPVQAIYSNWSGGQYLRLDAANHLQLVASGTLGLVTSTVAITDLNAHHVVATKNGPTMKLYIDGVDVTGAGPNYTFASAPTWMAIGYDPSNEQANLVMDEIAIYATALSPARVLAHFNAGKTPPSTGTNVTIPVPSGPLLAGQVLAGQKLTNEGITGDTWLVRELRLLGGTGQVIFPIRDTTIGVETSGNLGLSGGAVVVYVEHPFIAQATTGRLDLFGGTGQVSVGVTIWDLIVEPMMLRGTSVTLFLDNIMRPTEVLLALLGGKVRVNPVLMAAVCEDIDLVALACEDLVLVAIPETALVLEELDCVEA